jgi:hypothetical protein
MWQLTTEYIKRKLKSACISANPYSQRTQASIQEEKHLRITTGQEVFKNKK